MAILKCKMCGGTIEYVHGATVGECQHCGTKQTLPNTSDEIVTNLFNRANNLRLKCDFDKAMAAYEKIVEQDDSLAEAHWGIVLCKYGIEYVDDPASHTKIPTCHRTLYNPVTKDTDYQAAIDYADTLQQSIYEKEARAIDKIQKNILAIVQNEKPFDVFICYKETDEYGKRTKDSVLANDIYYQLIQEGFKVFYAAITLEDKLGHEYEPYIFAALNTAKVMLVIGSESDYFNSVWVKNEWSRFMSLMKTDRSKILIPCYRDMDAYDLPEEFSHLQAQDMSKLGFMQDLIRGIKKIAKADEQKATVSETFVVGTNNANVVPLLERAFMFLEDGKWSDANIYCEKVLDIAPKNAEAYLGKLMADLQVRTRKQLADYTDPFDDRENYNKVLRFGDDKLKAELREYIAHINERNENARMTGIYNGALSAMKEANTESAYKAAAESFKTLHGFKDSDALVEQCLDKAEVCRKDTIYASAHNKQIKNSVAECKKAIRLYESISGWKDAGEQIYACRRKIEEIKAKEEADRLEIKAKEEADRLERKRKAEQAAKKRKIVTAIVATIVVSFIVFMVVRTKVILPNAQYNAAFELYNAGKYEDAYKAFIFLDYKDSADKAAECLFLKQKSGLTNVTIGSTIRFGFYEQDNNTSNGKEEIEWFILAVEGKQVLVVSQYALDCQQYNTSYTNVTWEECTLRTWLNSTFYNSAFGSDHQKMIVNSTVTADRNPLNTTSPGNNTTDKVFLLSTSEVYKYVRAYDVKNWRNCSPTDYAIAQGANVSNYFEGSSWWWLRTSGYDLCNAAVVYENGSTFNYGNRVDNADGAVRPALWINLES